MTDSMLSTKNWKLEKRRALSATEIVAGLAQVQGWRLAGDDDNIAIEKNFQFANYFETIAFVNALAMIAHRLDHHPDLYVKYDCCVVKLNTHDVGGISRTDLECATLVDALLSKVP
jgi:4a-hydroxytetrahydrobiopterin dehydratase